LAIQIDRPGKITGLRRVQGSEKSGNFPFWTGKDQLWDLPAVTIGMAHAFQQMKYIHLWPAKAVYNISKKPPKP
jgi:hypothetical protein